MASLQEFLHNNPNLTSTNKLRIENVLQETSEITLSGIIVSASEDEKIEDGNYIVFSHLGQRFYINSREVNDIVEFQAIENSFEPDGIPVKITVKANTRLIPYEILMTAIDLESKKPFAIARPSQIPQIDNSSFTAKELAWLVDNAIPKNTEIQNATSSTICYVRGRPADDIQS